MENLPQHIAIVMDGNGRWAKKRLLPRFAGHKAGVDAVRRIVRVCGEQGIKILTLFAFGSENWRRPEQEVNHLMGLFMTAMQSEAKKLHKENVQVRIIGERSRLSEKLREAMLQIEELTRDNTGLKLVVAVSYSGQWDVTNAMQKLAAQVEQGTLKSQDITPELIQENLATAELPNPDLFIRTSGEQRISNFLIWQLAYAELYFTEVFWPDFDETELKKALDFYAKRERRFGKTSEQLGTT